VAKKRERKREIPSHYFQRKEERKRERREKERGKNLYILILPLRWASR
jgi:hypothetical protein|tara:strand:- start:321 stop:464 length:144 start_codon:yes stop_codon:yes gene_type:complete